MANREGTGSKNPKHDPAVTYFYDFIRILERDYAFASVAGIAEEIDYARAVGWAIAGLEKRPGGIYVMRTPIGYGDFAFIELEFDKRGVLQPVMGGFIKNRK